MPSPRTSVSAVIAAAALAFAGAATGCGGAEVRPERARERALTIAMHDYYFRPQAARAEPGKLRVTLSNDARIPHNFRLQHNGRLYAEVTALKPGEQETHTYELPRGSYKMFCSIANHEELGMYGRLTVGAP
jgi:plastocyanin